MKPYPIKLNIQQLLLIVLFPTFVIAQPALWYSHSQTGVLHDVAAVLNGEQVWVAAENGIFQFFENGNPVQVHVPFTANPSAYSISLIARPNASEVLYVGGVGYVAWTEDFGVSWTVLHPGNSNLNANDTVQQAVGNAQSDIWLRINNQVKRQVGSTFQNSGFLSPSLAISPVGCCDVFMANNNVNDPPVFQFQGGSVTNWLAMTTSRGNSGFPAFIPNVAKQMIYNDMGLWLYSGSLYFFNGLYWELESHYNSSHLELPIATIADSIYLLEIRLNVVGNNLVRELVSPLLGHLSLHEWFKGIKGFEDCLYLLNNNVVIQLPAAMLGSTSKNIGRIKPNNIATSYNSTGGLFTSLPLSSTSLSRGFEFDSASAMYAGQLWFRGIQGASDTLISAESFRQSRVHSYSGPISNVYDRTYLEKYDRIWTVTKNEIQQHRLSYALPGYMAPENIRLWPGNGDVSKGEAAILAPFEDYNFNGLYEPLLGEVPRIRGSEAAYFIFNNARGTGLDGIAQVGKIEVHCMAYGYDSVSSNGLNNTLFLSYRIINRSSDDIQHFEPFLWLDGDLGYGADDLTGSDSLRQEAYFYNADLDDPFAFGFGQNPPAVGISFLNEPITGCVATNNWSTTNYSWSSDAQSNRERWNIMDMRWKDGTPLVIQNPSGLGNNANGLGYNPSAADSITHWHFNHVKNWYHPPTYQADKRILLRSSKYNLSSGDEVCLDIAIAAGRDLNATNIGSSLSVVQTHLNEVKQFYSALLPSCLNFGMGADAETPNKTEIYPNPVQRNEWLTIEFEDKELFSYNWLSLDGSTLVHSDISSNLSKQRIYVPSNFTSGVYLLQLHWKNGAQEIERIMVY